MRLLIIFSVVVVALLLLAGCSPDSSQIPIPESSGPVAADSALDKFERFQRSRFGFFSAYRSYPFVSELGVHWERPHPGPFIWGEIEKNQGTYDWTAVDKYVSEAQKYDVILVATIWPYANWDQERCHEKLPGGTRRTFPILGEYRGKPCDPEAYQRFVKALVERYDGDGVADMPGLVYPVKYWETSNEPDIEEGQVFFKGNPQTGDYLEVLEDTYNAVKEADPDAKSLNGGIAYLSEKEKPFWRVILGRQGSRYVDILTIHSITLGDDLQLPPLYDLLDELSLDRPVWVTEIQYAKSSRFLQFQGQAQIPSLEDIAEVSEGHGLVNRLQNLTEEEWSALLVKSFVEAFGRGATNLFYIGLDDSTPTETSSLLVNCRHQAGRHRGGPGPFDPATCQKQKPFFAYKTLVEKVDYFQTAQKLADGQFRFSVDDSTVYVLWGSGPLPAEIQGQIRLTDIYGQQREVDASSLDLTDVPVYIEN